MAATEVRPSPEVALTMVDLYRGGAIDLWFLCAGWGCLAP